ncbi:MAG: DUF4160 domain-containing protein [Anaerolineales bacterium]|nr:DUF4160 domain-containing protein [Anaerolineales bacterium]
MPSRKIDGYLFQFYSSDENEPPHVHVKRSGNVTKIWLEMVEVQYNRGYNESELNKILRLTLEHRVELLEMWNDHFSS